MSRELPSCDLPCEECGAKPAWDFPWAGVFCSKCAGFDKSKSKQCRAEKRKVEGSDTPLTDALAVETTHKPNLERSGLLIDHARKLEGELRKAKAQLSIAADQMAQAASNYRRISASHPRLITSRQCACVEDHAAGLRDMAVRPV